MRAAGVVAVLAASVLLGGCRDSPRADPPPADHVLDHVLDDVEWSLRDVETDIEADIAKERDADRG